MPVGSADSSADELRSSIEPGCSSEISVSENGRPWVSVVVLNYRNWGDTIECLESLLRLDYPCFEIIVCDNDSRDGSVENILAWARGELLPTARHAGVAATRPSGFEPLVAHRLVPTEQVGVPVTKTTCGCLYCPPVATMVSPLATTWVFALQWRVPT